MNPLQSNKMSVNLTPQETGVFDQTTRKTAAIMVNRLRMSGKLTGAFLTDTRTGPRPGVRLPLWLAVVVLVVNEARGGLIVWAVVKDWL